MEGDTFKLADEVRAENHGEVWNAETETAIPAEVVTPDAIPETPTEVPTEQVDETTEQK